MSRLWDLKSCFTRMASWLLHARPELRRLYKCFPWIHLARLRRSPRLSECRPGTSSTCQRGGMLPRGCYEEQSPWAVRFSSGQLTAKVDATLKPPSAWHARILETVLHATRP